MDLQKLKKPFDPTIISWRVGATSKDKKTAIALAYIDARDVMERFDEVCGIGGWQCRYSHADKKTIAEIGIKIDSEWVWKANGAGDTQVEAEKGAISDAMKRAAVLWGVGRYLYDVANVWVDITPYGRSYKIKNLHDIELQKALKNASNGIRLQALPLSDKEHEGLISAINQCKTLDYLGGVWTDINKRMKEVVFSDEQKIAIENTKNNKKLELTPPQSIKQEDINAPIEGRA